MQVRMGGVQEKYAVINADDLGIDARINAGIADCCRYGMIRSVSLAACGAAFDDAVSRIIPIPGIGIGAHLCLVDERPVLPAHAVPTLVDKSGKFHGSCRIFLFRLWSGMIDMHEIEDECDAQIRRIMKKGIVPTHIDSHQYVHLAPRVLASVIKLARKYGIRWIRYPAHLCDRHPCGVNSLMKRAWLSCTAGTSGRMIIGQGLSVPDRSYGVAHSGCLDKAFVQKYLRRIVRGVSDLVCHPGYTPCDIRYRQWEYAWEKEAEAFMDPALLSLAHDLGIRFGNYER